MYNDNNNDAISSEFLFFYFSREFNIVRSCNGPTEFLNVIFLYSFRFHELEIELLEMRFQRLWSEDERYVRISLRYF